MPSNGSHRVKVQSLNTGYLDFEILSCVYVLDDDSTPQYGISHFEISEDLEVNTDIYLYNEDESDYITHYWAPLGMAQYMTTGGVYNYDKIAV